MFKNQFGFRLRKTAVFQNLPIKEKIGKPQFNKKEQLKMKNWFAENGWILGYCFVGAIVLTILGAMIGMIIFC